MAILNKKKMVSNYTRKQENGNNNIRVFKNNKYKKKKFNIKTK